MPDTFQEIIKTKRTGSSGGGGGDVPTGSYFAIGNNLSEGTPATMRGNLGLTDGSASISLNTALIGNLSIAANSISNDSGNTFIESIEFNGATISGASANIVTIGDDLTVTGLASLDGGIDVDGVFTIADTTGALTGTSADFSGAVEVNSLDIGTTGHGFDSAGNVSALGITVENSTTALIDMFGGDSGVADGDARLRLRSLNATGINTAVADIMSARDEAGNARASRLEFYTRQTGGTITRAGYFDSTQKLVLGFRGVLEAGIKTENNQWYYAENTSGTEERLLGVGTDNRVTLGGIDGNSTGVTIRENGSSAITIDSGNTTVLGDLTAEANLLMDTGNAQAANYALTTDFSGTGWQGSYAGDFNIRNLVVRESARFRELIIDQLAVIAGSDLRSVGRGKIKEVDNTAKTVTLDNPRNISASSFIANDFFWIKEIDIDGTTFLDLKGQITAVTVTTVSGEEIIKLTLDTTVTGGTHEGTTTDLSALNGGEVIVQRGHPTDADRQALIYTSVSDTDAPVQKYFTGIDSLGAFDAVANISTQVGNLEGLTSTYANVTGEGLYSSNAYLTDSILIGDLSKASNYLEYNGSALTVNAGSFNLSVNNLSINSSNQLITIGADTLSTESLLFGKTDAGSVGNYDGKFGLDFNANNYWKLVADYSGDGTTDPDWVEFKVGGSTSNYIDIDTKAGTIDINTDTLELNTSTFYLDSASKLVLGSSASSQTLNTGNAVGMYANTSGHFRVGSNDIAGDIGEGIRWDGTDFLVEAGAISVTSSGTSLSALDISGTLTMGASGKITNAGGDYVIDADGIHTQPSTSFENERGFTVRDGSTIVGGLWGTSTDMNLRSDLGDISIIANDDLILGAGSAGGVVAVGGGALGSSVQINAPTLGFFGTPPISKRSIDNASADTEVTELQDILIAYGLATDNR